MKLTYIVTIATRSLVGTFAYADDMTIEMLNKREDGAKMVLREDIANIDVGDTITWVSNIKRSQCTVYCRTMTVGIQ